MQKVVTKDDEKRVAKSKGLSEYFTHKKDKIERNSAIIQAIEDGYTQTEGARYIGLSRLALS